MKLIDRILTKPGYKVIAAIAMVYMIGSYYANNLYTVAHVDADGYVYATTVGNAEMKYLDNPMKLNNSNAVNFDTWVYDSEK